MPATAYQGPQRQGPDIADYATPFLTPSHLRDYTRTLVGRVDGLAAYHLPKTGDRTPEKPWAPYRPIAAALVLHHNLAGLYSGDLPAILPEGISTNQLFTYFAMMNKAQLGAARQRHEHIGEIIHDLGNDNSARIAKDLFAPSILSFERGFFGWDRRQVH